MLLAILSAAHVPEVVMEARPSQILEFFNGTKQMLVPLFQRPYEWGPSEWETLWADLLEQYERTEEESVASHFTGAIVTAPARSVPVGVSKYLVIDGQQRLTTVTILICAMRSLFESGTKEYRKLTRLLVNEDDDGLDHFKLLPTQPDRAAFQALIAATPQADTRFTQAFEFFQKKLAGNDSDGAPINSERLATAVQSRLTVVAIHLGDTDDPYLIFESLNAKGTPLTQADLVRNYLLLRLHSNAQQKAYEEAWLPMQAILPGEHLTEFMRQYLMMNGEEVAKSAIYTVLKKRLLDVQDAAIAGELLRMQKASVLYANIVGLTAPTDATVGKGLARLHRWDIATANPFILKLLLAHSRAEVSATDVASSIALIESFVVRRAVCAVPTNQLKRIFLSITKDMPASGVPQWLSKTLAAGSSGRRWPKDDEFKDSLLRYRAYAQPTARCRFLLESIEEHHGHKEPAAFANATIEHVMPQTLTDEWRSMIGDNVTEIHEQWVDLLGNLTLTGYNSELSNSPFPIKKQLLSDSHFEMNKWIAGKEKWTEVELRERTELVFAKTKEIWPRPAE
ncbi:DUF262 domain-containing protein [Corallococcus exiguus]|uniref:DUF262 domain-containing protein n=1 Tax=Corallococcus exiguus TaxID=83462 RepID=A0A7X4Y9Q4_9BACT|nr:DUF262 domain-containing protein [Corallococcus exiguus]NBC41406.1 DUF262 domain-containing protein [Corallococcus exiguus]TNV67113.1 DUF262 domain-containing protein [Corallococcus exiguus]